jgi:lactate permease
MNLTAKAALTMLPIVTLLIIMLVLRWSAARAGVISLFVTILVAWLGFGYGSDVYADMGIFGAVGGAFSEAVFTAGTILWIIFPALCIHHFQVHTRAIQAVKAKTASLSEDPRIIALLIFWFFALFGEGLAGFGTPVALTAPFLVAIGFRPVDSVAVALMGHSVGSSFGAVGTPILPQIASTGFDGLQLARATGFYHSILGWVMLFIPMFMLNRAMENRRNIENRLWIWTALAALLFLLPFFSISRWVGPELPTLGGALFGGLAFVIILRFARRNHGPPKEVFSTGNAAGLPKGLLRLTAPYWAPVSLILLTRLILPVKEVLSSVTWEWVLMDTFRGKIQPFYHPGTMLFLGLIAGAALQGAKHSAMKAAMAETMAKLLPVVIALIAMLSLSQIMVHAGMIADLSAWAAQTAGGLWPLLSPQVGVLGTFVTGSATASNILFTEFQQSVAENLGLPVLSMVGAQGFGAAVGNMVCPHNIIAGGATVGLAGKEGSILGKTMVGCLIYSMLGGLVALGLARFQ